MYAKGAPPAVDALDLDINDGEFMVLVGPSGSGKTTALRMLAGLEPLDGGRVEIGDRDVTFVPPKDRDIAMVFQNYALYPQKTVAENMGFALKMQGVPRDERDRRVREAARLLDLDEQLLDRKPKQLSGGQRQRVAMGRAIVREPKVFLMDEPLSNLDAKLRVQTRSQIAELQRRLGITTVYVTHDQVEAMTMGNRVAVLSRGAAAAVRHAARAVRQPGEPVRRRVHRLARDEPADRPAHRRRRPGGGHHAPAARPRSARAARQAGLSELVLGIRPEHLHLADGSGELAGEVMLVEELGADALLHVRLAEDGGPGGGAGRGAQAAGPGTAGHVPRPAGGHLRVPPGDGRPPCGLNRRQPLNARTLAYWSGRLPVPAYDRGLVTPGVVHFGVGGFHRAHQAMYLDRLMNEGAALDWGICGVGVMAADRRMQQALDAQDGLYTLVLKHSDGTYEPRVIGSIVEYLFAPDDPEAVIEKMAGRVDPDRVADGHRGRLQHRRRHRRVRRGQPGRVARPRARRGAADRVRPDHRGAAAPPEARPGAVHGHVLRQPAGQRPADQAGVHRVRPAARPGARRLGRARGALPQLDGRPHHAGDDRRRPGRGPGAVRDRRPLAGGLRAVHPVGARGLLHRRAAAVRAGRGAGRRPGRAVRADEAAAAQRAATRRCATSATCAATGSCTRPPRTRCSRPSCSATWTRRPPRPCRRCPASTSTAYKHTLIERFSNPQVRDTIARLCAESSDRIPKWLLPVVRQQLATGGEIRRSAAVVASWARYAEGVDEQGEPIEVVDRLRDSLIELARRQRTQPDAFITNRDVFGDLAEHERFVAAYLSALASLHERGARATLEWLVRPDG